MERELPPYLIFDSTDFHEVAKWQRVNLQRLLTEGYLFRDVGIADETNFDTKIKTYRGFIRCFNLEYA